MRSLDPERWERVQRLFHAALEVPRDEQERFVRANADDDDVVADVLAMLAADAAPDSPLEGDAGWAADALLDMREAPGRRLGPYVLGEPLGEGGSAVVYRAHRHDLGNTVAIKILRDAWVSPSRRRRFHAEQRALAALSHPNIARLLDADTLEDGTPYFVMEYVEGTPITVHCAQQRLSLVERLQLFRAVCDAVQHAHAHALVHRDIKPSNVLVTADDRVKLLDFGIAKHLDELDAEDTATRTGLRPMTPAYAAPEQIRGDGVGVYTDVFALGVMLREMLTGRRPGNEAAAHSRNEEIDAVPANYDGPTSMTRATRADLECICSVAMHDDPARRYPTVEAMGRDVERFLRGLPLEARPDSLRYRAGKFVRRNRHVVAAALAVMVIIVAGSIGHTVRLSAARDRAETEAAKAREVTDYLVGIFEAADPYAETPETDVRTLLDRGEAQVEALAAQPQLQAELLGVLGRVRVALSDFERAELLLGRTLEVRRNESDPLAVANALVEMGRLHYHTGNYDDGVAALNEAVAIRSASLRPDDPALAEALDELGVLTASRGDYAGADTLYTRALAIRRTVHATPHPDLGISLNNVAVNRFNLGQFDSSAEHYEQAIAVERAIYGTDHPTVATTLANYGKLHEQLGHFDEAEELLSEALRIRQARLGPDHYETALSLSQLGGLLQQAGELERAEQHLREALAIRERILGPDHPGVGTTLNGLGLLLVQRAQYDEAVDAFRRVISIYAAALGADHRFTGVATGNLAAALHAGGRLDDAEREYRRSIAILSAVHPPDHPELGWNVGRFGILLADALRDEEAEPLLRRAHASLLAAHGAEHQRTRQVTLGIERIDGRRVR